MIDRRSLMRLQVRALFTHDENGRLRQVNEPGGRDAPRFYLGRTPDGNEWRVRHDVPGATVRGLDLLCAEIRLGLDTSPPKAEIDRFGAVLGRDEPVRRIWSGPAYRFPVIPARPDSVVRVTPTNAELLRPYLAEWLAEACDAGQLMFAALDHGEAVSVCSSVRITPEAHEVGVETAAGFRRRGLGAAVVSAWARAVAELGAVPLYSTSWDNAGSIALANSLGLVQFGSNLHLT